jgi:hypothetical protein
MPKRLYLAAMTDCSRVGYMRLTQARRPKNSPAVARPFVHYGAGASASPCFLPPLGLSQGINKPTSDVTRTGLWVAIPMASSSRQSTYHVCLMPFSQAEGQ